MKPAPQLHPVDLLMGMTRTHQPTTDKLVKLEVQMHAKDDAVVMQLATGDEGLQLHLKSPQAIEDMREGLRKMLNVWDINAPMWLWQLDAFLDPVARELSDDAQAAKGLPR